jgi:hypothetical protein
MAKSATRMRFERAFRDARDAGEKTFEFEGKSYSTKMKATPTPPKRDVPRVDDEPSPPYSDAPSPSAVARPAPAESSVVTDPQTGIVPRRYGTVRSGFYRAGENEVQGPEKPPTMGRLRTVGGNMAETNAGYPAEKPLEETGYRKGGMVKKKSGGMMKKKSGGSVRGGGIAQRGHGKMRMC